MRILSKAKSSMAGEMESLSSLAASSAASLMRLLMSAPLKPEERVEGLGKEGGAS